jgi:homoserine dehydrogenase
MSFLINSFAPTEGGGQKWSVTVRKAKQLGYTEPDPRDDLNGIDIARKLTILSRLAGLPIESPTSFLLQNLVPQELQAVQSGEEFLQRLPEFDNQMEMHKAAAEREGKFVRFVGSIDMPSREVKVGMERFARSHPIAALQGSGNIISFYTRRYGENPLIVEGAGAGGDVIAMGVSGDLLKTLPHIAW